MMTTTLILTFGWVACPLLGFWIYREEGPLPRGWHLIAVVIITFAIGPLWLLPIALYPFLKEDGII